VAKQQSFEFPELRPQVIYEASGLRTVAPGENTVCSRRGPGSRECCAPLLLPFRAENCFSDCRERGFSPTGTKLDVSRAPQICSR